MNSTKMKAMGELQMELTDVMASELKDLFNIEIEMMQGTTEKLPDGRTRYTVKIESEEKLQIIKRFILAAMYKDIGN